MPAVQSSPTVGLELRDIHLPPEPSWWPPAPGWWVLALLVIVMLVWLGRILRRQAQRRARRVALTQQFDRAAILTDVRSRVEAISELLRRAARMADPNAAQLQGDDWLRWLDGGRTTVFTEGPGRVLVEGLYRPNPDAHAASAVIEPARVRFLELLEGPR